MLEKTISYTFAHMGGYTRGDGRVERGREKRRGCRGRGRTHEIGRSLIRPAESTCNGWISLPGDRSISRNHACASYFKTTWNPYTTSLQYSTNLNELFQEQQIFIRDISKFGVSLDSVSTLDLYEIVLDDRGKKSLQSPPGERKIKRDQDVELKHGPLLC
eukprot:747963-Hanusia_phi.AAC.3